MRYGWLIFLLVLSTASGASELSAQLDRDRITDAETVILSVIASGDVRGDLDLSPLEADFDLIDQRHTARMSLINGLASSSREWRLELAPRRAGQLRIPPLQLGDLSSEPLTLEVVDAATAAGSAADRDVFVEVSATPEAPYVQGYVDYRVRLFSRVPLRQPQLSNPEVDGAIVQRFGDDRQSSETIGGERYTVIERRYAVFPQRSGPLSIGAPRLTAVVPVERAAAAADGPGQDPFGPIADVFGGAGGLDGLFTATRRVRVRGPDATLEVRPQPVGAPTPWLPAESVELSDEWLPADSEVEVGAAVTRTITVTAAGVTAAQLPDLELSAPPAIKLYSDPPQTEELSGGEVPVAVKQLKVALVATEPGSITLPEIRLSWWDTQADQPREALVPARALNVTAAGTAPDTVVAREAVVVADPPSEAAEAFERDPLTAAPAWLRDEPWLWLAALLALAWVTTIGLWWRERRRPRLPIAEARSLEETVRPRLSLAEARRAVERACQHRGPRELRDALLAWGAVKWPEDPPRALAAVARRLGSDEAAAAVMALERGLYANETLVWDDAACWMALASGLTEDERQAADSGESDLPDLYPTTQGA